MNNIKKNPKIIYKHIYKIEVILVVEKKNSRDNISRANLVA